MWLWWIIGLSRWCSRLDGRTFPSIMSNELWCAQRLKLSHSMTVKTPHEGHSLVAPSNKTHFHPKFWLIFSTYIIQIHFYVSWNLYWLSLKTYQTVIFIFPRKETLKEMLISSTFYVLWDKIISENSLDMSSSLKNSLL